MKIYTITCHDVYNYGASLQAYALQRYLKQLGHEVKIINYKPDYLSQHYKLFPINSPAWNSNIITRSIYLAIKLPGRLVSLKRKAAFDKYTNGYLKLTPKRYVSNEQLRNELTPADAYICGSDQIWNCIFPNGKDPAFYLDFAPESKLKISYAASFSMDSIPEEWKGIYRKRIQRLDHISVRENDGIKLLNSLGINRGVQVSDPVFLLDRPVWDRMCTGKRYKSYVLIYSFDNNEKIAQIACQIAKEKGCRIFSIFKMKCAYKCFENASPNEFLGLIKNAEHIITNSFHAAAFSIIFNKNFTVAGREEKLNTRITSLLQSLDLSDKYVSDQFDMETALKEIGYKSVGIKLNHIIEKSKKFLSTTLSKVK